MHKTVKINVRQITPVVPPPPANDVQVTLDMHTAELLVAVLRRIGGAPSGNRGVFDALHDMLDNAGVEEAVCDIAGSITFGE